MEFLGIRTRSGAVKQPIGDDPVIRKFDFSFATAGLTAGVTVFTPTVGDVLLDAWVEIVTAFNGTTPKADIGDFTSANTGWFTQAHTAPIDLTVADVAAASGTDLRIASTTGDNALAVPTAGGASREAPGRFAVGNPVKLVISQNGQKSGTATGATAGAGTVYVVTGTPQ